MNDYANYTHTRYTYIKERFCEFNSQQSELLHNRNVKNKFLRVIKGKVFRTNTNSWTVLKTEAERSSETPVINCQSNVLIFQNTLIIFSKKLMKILNLGNNLLSKKMLPSASTSDAWVCSCLSVSQWALSYLRVIYTGVPFKRMTAIDYSSWHTYT